MELKRRIVFINFPKKNIIIYFTTVKKTYRKLTLKSET